jgi:hypothetical protein
MNIFWEIQDADIEKLLKFVEQNESVLMKKRLSINIKRQGIILNKNIILKGIILCLLTSQ